MTSPAAASASMTRTRPAGAQMLRHARDRPLLNGVDHTGGQIDANAESGKDRGVADLVPRIRADRYETRRALLRQRAAFAQSAEERDTIQRHAAPFNAWATRGSATAISVARERMTCRTGGSPVPSARVDATVRDCRSTRVSVSAPSFQS